MIAILWVKVLIFQGAKPIFNVGSLSFLFLTIVTCLLTAYSCKSFIDT